MKKGIKMKNLNVAVVGASGLVGRKILEILEERKFPVGEFFPFASAKSKGKEISFRGESFVIDELTEDSFKGKDIDIALFAAGGSVSEKYIPLFIEEGIKVVDNSSFFRMADGVPLVIPEVNGSIITEKDMLIANPNCSTIQSVLALKPIYDKYGIDRIVYNTYQAVSGGGELALEDLYNKTNKKWKYKIDNNVLAQIDVFEDNGYTKEEMKMVNETRKILEDPSLKITATAVRVPVENSHGVSCNLSLKNPFDLDELRKDLESFPGIKVVDDIKEEIYPIPTMATGTDDVYVGRIRKDESIENGLNIWIIADNIRKGAATNAVMNAEILMGVNNDF